MPQEKAPSEQEEKWDIAKLSIPIEIEIPIEWTEVCFKK